MLNFLKGNSTREDIAVCLEHILNGSDHVWGDFTDIVQRDPELDALRLKVLALESTHPPGRDDYHVNAEARALIAGYVHELRNGGNSWMHSWEDSKFNQLARTPMLQMRPGCECCDTDLPADSTQAWICSFECTFCTACVETRLGHRCPNCGGAFSRRPARTGRALEKYPASTERVFKPEGCASP